MRIPKFYTTFHRAEFAQIDPFGHLNTNHYITYFLSHRFTALRECFGLDLKAISEMEMAFYTKSLSLEFVRPVVGDQPFSVKSGVTSHDETSCLISCEMRDEKNRLLSTATISLACVDKKSGKSSKWPESFMERFYE